jgi:hypothetical protein
MKEESPGAMPVRNYYDVNKTLIYACRSDPRFSYCLYVPPDYDHCDTAPELIVAMHGTGRAFHRYRDAYTPFGRWHNCLILCPLFPADVLGDSNAHGFKHLLEGDIRYDRVLLAMVDEVSRRYGLDLKQFALVGYSGGGQFTHRFLMLHAQRLWAASIGAPGSVTLLDPERDWWVGTRDVMERFGQDIDLDALRGVSVHMIVGDADLETWEITHRPGGRYWMPEANGAGATRPDRLQALCRSFEAAGVAVLLQTVPGASHDMPSTVDRVQDFLSGVLERRRAIG